MSCDVTISAALHHHPGLGSPFVGHSQERDEGRRRAWAPRSAAGAGAGTDTLAEMEAREYRDQLLPILAASEAGLPRRLERFRLAAEEADAVDGVLIDVFLDQDGEGPFDVWARFDGDGAFALNCRFDDERHLFGVEWGEDGWEPDVPGRPLGWTRDDLELAVLDVVAEWILPLTPPESPEGFWRIGTPDGTSAGAH